MKGIGPKRQLYFYSMVLRFSCVILNYFRDLHSLDWKSCTYLLCLKCEIPAYASSAVVILLHHSYTSNSVLSLYSSV